MNVPNLLTLSVIFTLMLLIVQRAEAKRRSVVGAVLLLPSLYLIYRWGVYRQQLPVVLVSIAVGLTLNVVFWLAYGRKHPPPSSDEITVIGMED